MRPTARRERQRRQETMRSASRRRQLGCLPPAGDQQTLGTDLDVTPDGVLGADDRALVVLVWALSLLNLASRYG
ncbi:MAG: hypothetical protein ABI468_06290, partial [Candidatus Nanopelagicales bacterium]